MHGDGQRGTSSKGVIMMPLSGRAWKRWGCRRHGERGSSIPAPRESQIFPERAKSSRRGQTPGMLQPSVHASHPLCLQTTQGALVLFPDPLSLSGEGWGCKDDRTLSDRVPSQPFAKKHRCFVTTACNLSHAGLRKYY